MPRPQADRGAGVVYTRAWVVDLMLDLIGYDVSADLGAHTIVEPGCGDGAFLSRIVPRLAASAKEHGRPLDSLTEAVRGYELDPESAERARTVVANLLVQAGASEETSRALAIAWVVQGDFLLDEIDIVAQWVVGNPPYVRVEEADPAVYAAYRERWTTMSGRADIYIGFFEAGLSLLAEGGKLCFICADRWMHNQYGAGLRRHVVDNFALELLLELHQSDVFDVPVAAYPAITVIERASHSSTALATARPTFGASSVLRFRQWLAGDEKKDLSEGDFSAAMLEGRLRADGSWPSGPPERLRLIADLEARLPSLSEVGISIGVGIATGADKVYVVSEPGGVEPELLKRAIGPADLRDGVVKWAGRQIVSPWKGLDLVDLAEYPGAKAHFEKHAEALKSRYVGKRNPNAWWRTIDRPPSDDYKGPKLIVADINDKIEPVLDTKGYWPLHSAYYITSSEWDLEALGGYLLSDIAGAFVEAYSVKMANGHLRVSAQYLKKIRMPKYSDVGEENRLALAKVFADRDRREATSVVARILDVEPGE
ncbi:Eco57I restriction-modification methylase domain-containing protein [Microbacterium sp. MMO-10]|uniref:Eco57I restriction-modification methylase domain-containing protein n=1 Tax=Microbacterium sp. MMO-10 TaxID=3081272 RepID=UPI0030186A0E